MGSRAWTVASTVALLACGGDGDASNSASASSGTATSGGDGGATSSGVGASSSSPASTGVGGGAGGAGVGSGGGGAATGGSAGGGSGPIGCVTAIDPGHHEFPCDGGIVYDVEIPAPCAQMPCGLIVDMHGFSMNADAQDENTGMRALGQQHGYVVVQPTASGTPPGWTQATDVPLVFAFLQDVAAALGTDAARAHAMGFSQGGGMTFRLVCQHADFFASVSPIGAIAGCEFQGANTPTEEVDILQVHGHTDALVSFDGIAVPQRDAALAAWSFGASVILEEDAAHKATRWTTATGTVFEFWEHDYEAEAFFLNGHCVPGGNDLGGAFAYSCVEQGTFVYGEIAMQFFLDHPK